ncbi:MAG: M14 family metallopeptidase, partial [Phycisphaerales bacterium JB064]
MRLCVVLACVGLAAGVACAQQQEGPYAGHKQVRLPMATRAVMEAIELLSPDIWTHRVVPLRPVDLRLSPEQYERFLDLGLAHQVIVNDLQAVVDAERARIAARSQRDDVEWYEEYRTLDEYWTRWQAIVDTNPDVASLSVVGQSLEGRDMPGIVLNGDGREGKPVFVINACQHAREWVSPAATTYMIEQLVSGYGSDARITRLLDEMEWVFLPMVNPDGFDYTWTDERFWRKNKRIVGGLVRGVDLNRNWSFEWGGAGSSSSPGSNNYRGAEPFSEPELVVYRDSLEPIRDRIVGHLDVHTHSQQVLSPWGYTTERPNDIAEMTELGEVFARGVLEATGAVYEVGPASTTLYLHSGTATDWFYGEEGAFSWTIELRPLGPITLPGFDPPPDQILPAGEELLEGTLRLAQEFVRHPADLDRDDALTIFDYLRF